MQDLPWAVGAWGFIILLSPVLGPFKFLRNNNPKKVYVLKAKCSHLHDKADEF